MQKARCPLAVLNTQGPWVVGGQADSPEPWPGSCFLRGGGGTTLPPLKCPKALSRLLHTLPQPSSPTSKAGAQKVLGKETNKEMYMIRVSGSHH